MNEWIHITYQFSQQANRRRFLWTVARRRWWFVWHWSFIGMPIRVQRLTQRTDSLYNDCWSRTRHIYAYEWEWTAHSNKTNMQKDKLPALPSKPNVNKKSKVACRECGITENSHDEWRQTELSIGSRSSAAVIYGGMKCVESVLW